MEQGSYKEIEKTEFDTLLERYINNTKLKEGTIIKGTISEIEDETIIVDIGAKVEGRISRESLHFKKIKRN